VLPLSALVLPGDSLQYEGLEDAPPIVTIPRRPADERWIATADGFIGAAWYWPSGPRVLTTAVLLVPGIAHEERTTSVGVAALADALAVAGLPALAITVHGTALSAGQLNRADIGERWRDDIRVAMQHLRSNGFARVIVVGVRLGALLALDALRDDAIFGMAAWAPIASGSRHLRELRVLQTSGQAEAQTTFTALSIGGFELPAPVLNHLGTLELVELARIAPRRMLVLDRASQLHAKWLDHFADRAVSIDRRVSNEVDEWLFGDEEQPALPHQDIETVTSWCLQLHEAHAPTSPGRPRPPPPSKSIAFEHAGRPIRETYFEIGPVGLSAVWCEPAGPLPPGATDAAVRMLMSTIGPGRSFTDFARDEAARGRVSMRFDFAGFGTSPSRGNAPGAALYTNDGRDDVADAVADLHRHGHQRIVMLGFCAGAWSMMQAGPLAGVLGAAAINVALYRNPDPVPNEVDADPAFLRWLRSKDRRGWLRRMGVRLERTSSTKRPPIEWLQALWRADVAVLLAYADVDDGLDYLTRQLASGLRLQLARGRLALKVYEGLGHLIEGGPPRRRMFEDISAFFVELDRRTDEPVPGGSIPAAR
jgi:alpha-beta hydrolase superfamily lysophospholipase